MSKRSNCSVFFFFAIVTSVQLKTHDGEEHVSIESGAVVDAETLELRLHDVLTKAPRVELRTEVDAVLVQSPIHVQSHAEEISHKSHARTRGALNKRR